MAKYIIEIPDEVPVSDKLVPFDMCRPSWYWEAYKKGKAEAEDEVWEFCRMIDCDVDGDDMDELYGDYDEFYTKYTYQEAKSKYDAWKKSKEEVRVGDEVEYECFGSVVRFVVIEIYNEVAYGFKYPFDHENIDDYCAVDKLKKTGRHFDEVERLLERMREE